jgi:hypothetical protein
VSEARTGTNLHGGCCSGARALRLTRSPRPRRADRERTLADRTGGLSLTVTRMLCRFDEPGALTAALVFFTGKMLALNGVARSISVTCAFCFSQLITFTG